MRDALEFRSLQMAEFLPLGTLSKLSPSEPPQVKMFDDDADDDDDDSYDDNNQDDDDDNLDDNYYVDDDDGGDGDYGTPVGLT